MTRQNADRRSANAQSVITDNGVAKGRLGKLRARSQSLNSSSTAIAELPQPHSYLWIMCKQGKIRFFISKSSWERHLSDGPVKHGWLVVYLFCFTLLPTTTATLSHSQFKRRKVQMPFKLSDEDLHWWIGMELNSFLLIKSRNAGIQYFMS